MVLLRLRGADDAKDDHDDDGEEEEQDWRCHGRG